MQKERKRQQKFEVKVQSARREKGKKCTTESVERMARHQEQNALFSFTFHFVMSCF